MPISDGHSSPRLLPVAVVACSLVSATYLESGALQLANLHIAAFHASAFLLPDFFGSEDPVGASQIALGGAQFPSFEHYERDSDLRIFLLFEAAFFFHLSLLDV